MRKGLIILSIKMLVVGGSIPGVAYAQFFNGLPNHFINGSSDQYINVSPNVSVSTAAARMPSGRITVRHESAAAADMMPKNWRPGTSEDPQTNVDQAVHLNVEAGTTPGKCELKHEATLPMTEMAGHYMISVMINDHPANMMVDTGAEKTILETTSADAWSLPEDDSQAYPTHGVGGEAHSFYPRIISSLKFGPAEWTDIRVAASPSLGDEQRMQGNVPDGILGADILSRYDTEFDFPARTMTLYTAVGCLGHFVPWTGKYQSFSANQTRENRFIVMLGLNGHGTRALLDTGASQSLVSMKAADAAGVDSAALANDPRSSGTGMDSTVVHTSIHKFLMQISDSRFDGAPLLVADIDLRKVDMLLGMDFLKYRRVWVSYSTGWVFMQVATPEAQKQRVASVSLTTTRGLPNPTLFHR